MLPTLMSSNAAREGPGASGAGTVTGQGDAAANRSESETDRDTRLEGVESWGPGRGQAAVDSSSTRMSRAEWGGQRSLA